MSNDEVYCLSCDWSGEIEELNYNEFGVEFCPKCHSTDLEDVEEVTDDSNLR